MSFNSWPFAVFLPVTFLLYWFVFQRRVRWQNLFVVAASYLFYGWWDWRFLLLIAFTSGCCYLSGLGIERYARHARLINTANIVVNLAVLVFFKYWNFFVDSFAALFGLDPGSVTLNVILPVGISFYTFQALSYSIDVYRRRIAAEHDPVVLFAYISFFPQLVAGPIERATQLLPQFGPARTFRYEEAVDGCRLMLWGLFKKVVIADTCAEGANNIFAYYDSADGGILALGALLFAFQIYGDFSGYSDIAIGCSKLFGIRLQRNFNVPYFSRDIAEFWRRWHISLNTWFRDYVYIPLGGSRCGRLCAVRNTFVIFLLSGLWHGANWTYVAWGAFHALLFVPLLLTGRNRRFSGPEAASLREMPRMLLTLALVCIGWIVFRSETIADAWSYIVRMFRDFSAEGSLTQYLSRPSLRLLAWTMPLLLTAEWLSRNRAHALDFGPRGIFRFRAARWSLYYILTIFILANIGKVETFIYFQF